MAEKFFFKKEFRSKTAITRCGYCKVSIKEENLESHCKTAHKKPKLAAGQKTLESMFKRSHDSSESSLETDIVPVPPTKKQKLVDGDEEDDVEAEEMNNNPVETEDDSAEYGEAGAGIKVGDNPLVTEMGGDDMLTAEMVNLSADDKDRETGNLVEGGADDAEQAGNLSGDNLDRGTANLDVEHNNNIVSLVGSNLASLPAKVEELTKTINAIKTSVDFIKTKAIPDIATPVDVEPSDERLAVLLLCKSLDDILENFEELSYVAEENLLKCDLCCSKPRMGGNVPGLFKYDKDEDRENGNKNLSQRFRNLKAHLKAHLMNKTHIDHWEKWKCWWPRYHDCLESLKLGKFMGVDIINEHETKAYFTKLARKESDLALSTKAVDITRAKLESLVKRLSTDLKEDTFEKDTVECIEMIRNVSDVKSFAIKVRKIGAV